MIFFFQIIHSDGKIESEFWLVLGVTANNENTNVQSRVIGHSIHKIQVGRCTLCRYHASRSRTQEHNSPQNQLNVTVKNKQNFNYIYVSLTQFCGSLSSKMECKEINLLLCYYV